MDGIKEAERAGQVCGEEGRRLEGACAASWVTYFKQRRVMEDKKERAMEKLREEGAERIPEGVPLPGGDKGRPPAAAA